MQSSYLADQAYKPNLIREIPMPVPLAPLLYVPLRRHQAGMKIPLTGLRLVGIYLQRMGEKLNVWKQNK